MFRVITLFAATKVTYFANKFRNDLQENIEGGEKFIISNEDSLKLAQYLIIGDVEDFWHDSLHGYLIRSGINVEDDVEIIQGSGLYIDVTEPWSIRTI